MCGCRQCSMVYRCVYTYMCEQYILQIYHHFWFNLGVCSPLLSFMSFITVVLFMELILITSKYYLLRAQGNCTLLR